MSARTGTEPRLSGEPGDLSLFALLREDWSAYSPRPLARPGFHAMALHRFGHWQAKLPTALRMPARIAHDALYYITRVLYGIELPRKTKIGRRVVIYHQGGIVIGRNVEIGDDCVIRQNVTIGATRTGGPDPKIGHRVEIGAGAVVAGDIEVGDDSIIGPNAVVMTDVPPRSRVLAPAARIFPRDVAEPDGLGHIDERPPSSHSPDPAAVAALVGTTLELDVPVTVETPLLSSGLIDSFAVVVLVEALEQAYGVTIDADDVRVETFDTPRDIAAVLAGEHR